VTEHHLTEVERLQLVNQYDILAKLYPERADYYAKHRKIVEEGFTILYEELFSSVSDAVSMEECRYVFDVLDMYRALHNSYRDLADKGGIDPADLQFEGFDGNNESKQLSLAEFLQKDGKWVESLKADLDLNSHSMTRHRYGEMLEKWNALGDERHGRKWKLTKDEIKHIISRGK
jgi:uncharacterized protein YfbU (UPF0304 family)